ncbi:MAG: hypothetical protein ABSG45_08815 [Nitrososphaerales archaeon]
MREGLSRSNRSWGELRRSSGRLSRLLRRCSGLVSFNAKDIELGFVDAREKVPGNVADKILKNVWKGHMMQVKDDKDGLKAYVLTNTGTKFVESGIR